MEKFAKALKRYNPDLKEAELEGLLFLLKTKNGLSNNELIRETGLPKETLKTFKTSILSILENSNENEVKLNAEGSALLKSQNLKPYKWCLLDYTEEKYKKAAQQLTELRKKYNLEPKREFDQFFATSESSIAKIAVANEKGLLEGKHIALIGDDDLLSVTLGLLNISYLSLTVFDIDEQMLSTIKTITTELNMKNIRFELYDARKAPKPEFTEKYDVVITDPPYTKSGIGLFLNRALQLLQPATDFEGKYIFLYYGNSFKSPEKTVKIQEVIDRCGLLIEDKLNKFIRYYGAESVGSTSSLYILKKTKFSKPIESLTLAESIYTFENQKEEEFPFVDHVVAKVNKVQKTLLLSQQTLLNRLGKLCNQHKLKVVDTLVTKFKNGGLTITFVLSNSNLVVHTWPEYQALHIDLITCAPIFQKPHLIKTLSDIFETKFVEITEIE